MTGLSSLPGRASHPLSFRLPVRLPFGRVLPAALLAATLTGAVVTTGCGGKSEVIQIDGSSTVYLITEAIAEEFRHEVKGINVTVGVSGTGGGFQKFCRGETDISDASRPITATEIAACKAKGLEYLELPIAYDGLTVVVNPKNTWAQSMTVAELKKLWEPAAQNTITRWNHIRPEWPDKEIHLFGAGVDSGTFDYFTEAIVGKTDASRGDYTSSEDDNMLVQGIAGDEYALGFFGFAYYEENKTKLRAVGIDDEKPDNGAGPILPTPESISGGTYRPLSRPIFIYVNVKSLERPSVKTLVDFYVQHVPKLSREVGYVPLTDAEYQLVAQRAQARKTGTMFTTHHAESGTNLATLLAQAQ
jgi:phosphate transport system substrate-binding protein